MLDVAADPGCLVCGNFKNIINNQILVAFLKPICSKIGILHYIFDETIDLTIF